MLKAIKNIFQRELRFVSKDINIISIVLLAPLFYSLFYGTIYFNKVERDLPVVIIDNDNSETTKKLIRLLDAHQMIKIDEVVPDFQSGINKINSNEVYGMVYFAKDFESNLKHYKGATLKAYLNTSRFLVSNDINMAINETVINYNSEIKLNFFEKAGYNYNQAKELVEPLKYDLRPLFNSTESYGDFLVPGILVLIIQQTLLIGLAESMAKERESGTAGELYELSGKNIFTLIHGKGLLFGILFSAFSFLFFTFNFWLFKINLAGNVLSLILFTFLLITSVVYLSIFVASFFERKIIAIQFLSLTTYPIFLVSGYSWPMQAMPVWLQYLAKLIPSTPYLSAYVRITQMGAGLQETMPEFIHLLCLTIFLYLVTHIRLKSFINKKYIIKEVTQ
jgi:ABC-2 type transport system permease protein